uniref:Uncharacterized protein n=1 Tax=Rhizophora mucronata TaxID=61149 RepID=A0A2P2P8C3_RHIMU
MLFVITFHLIQKFQLTQMTPSLPSVPYTTT